MLKNGMKKRRVELHKSPQDWECYLCGSTLWAFDSYVAIYHNKRATKHRGYALKACVSCATVEGVYVPVEFVSG